MLAYYLRLAWKSLRRSPAHSLLIVAGIALGVAVATLFSTIRHTFAQDPIPAKSSVLYYVRMDSWDPAKPYPDSGDTPRPPTQITYRDMIEISRSDVPVRQSAMFKASLTVFPPPGQGRPSKELVRLCGSDFFPMFDVPFRYGSGWDRKADEASEPVVVLGEQANDRLFGGANSVGRLVRIESRDFRVVGVLAHWRPSIKFYDITQLATQAPEAFFIPLSLVGPMKIPTAGNSDGWISPPGPGFEAFLASETCWLQMWVELPTAEKVAAYKSFLDAYVTEQKRQGRFRRPLDNRVTPVLAWMREQNVVPPAATAMMIVALLFLGVCAFNLMGLLMAKFLARAPEVGVRRALGARRWDVFAQHVIECEVVALAGGALGLVLVAVSLVLVNSWFKGIVQRDDLFRLDFTMTGFAVAASLAAGLLAGVYPAFRVCRVPPAAHLKVH